MNGRFEECEAVSAFSENGIGTPNIDSIRAIEADEMRFEMESTPCCEYVSFVARNKQWNLACFVFRT